MRRILRAKIGMRSERGFSIIESLVACIIMIVGVSGLMALFAIAAAKNAGQGNQATRCTEYAQDKMEQLLALNFSDTNSQMVGSNTICPTCTGYNSAYGFGLGGTTVSSTPYGLAPATTSTAVVGYSDFVNSSDPTNADGISGSLTCTGCTSNAQFMRTWQIVNTTATTKTITVYVKALTSSDVSQSLAPSTTLIAVKQPY